MHTESVKIIHPKYETNCKWRCDQLGISCNCAYVLKHTQNHLFYMVRKVKLSRFTEQRRWTVKKSLANMYNLVNWHNKMKNEIFCHRIAAWILWVDDKLISHQARLCFKLIPKPIHTTHVMGESSTKMNKTNEQKKAVCWRKNASSLLLLTSIAPLAQ